MKSFEFSKIWVSSNKKEQDMKWHIVFKNKHIDIGWNLFRRDHRVFGIAFYKNVGLFVFYFGRGEFCISRRGL